MRRGSSTAAPTTAPASSTSRPSTQRPESPLSNPTPRIFDLLTRNCAHLDVELLHCAVIGTRRPCSVPQRRRRRRPRQRAPEPRASSTVAAVTLDALVDGPVDFLKIDIEGAESAALAACTKLGLVKQVVRRVPLASGIRRRPSESYSARSEKPDSGTTFISSSAHRGLSRWRRATSGWTSKSICSHEDLSEPQSSEKHRLYSEAGNCESSPRAAQGQTCAASSAVTASRQAATTSGC